GYFLSSSTTDNFSTAKSAIEHGNLWREQVLATRRSSLSDREIACAADYALRYETSVLNELERFSESKKKYIRMDGPECSVTEQSAVGTSDLRFRRNADPKGPLAVFGYDYFAERAKAAGIGTPKLLSYEGL